MKVNFQRLDFLLIQLFPHSLNNLLKTMNYFELIDKNAAHTSS